MRWIAISRSVLPLCGEETEITPRTVGARTGAVSSLGHWLSIRNSILCLYTILNPSVVGDYALKSWLTMSAFQVKEAVECVANLYGRMSFVVGSLATLYDTQETRQGRTHYECHQGCPAIPPTFLDDIGADS